MLGDRYAEMLGGYEKYTALREELHLRFPAIVGADNVGQPIIPPDQLAEIAPLIASLKSLAQQIVAGVDEDSADANALVAEFGPIAQTYFNDPEFPAPAVVGAEGAVEGVAAAEPQQA